MSDRPNDPNRDEDGSDGESSRYRRNRDVWSDHVRQQEFEHELIDRKTTWLLTTQALLFAAYGVTFHSNLDLDEVSRFRNAIAGVGVLIGLLIFVAVATLLIAKQRSWKDYEAHYKERESALPEPLGERGLQWGVRTELTRVALLPDLLLPLVFVAAWIYIWLT